MVGVQDPAERLGFLLWHLSQAFNIRAEHALAPLDLTLAQNSALMVLSAHPGASGAELARRCAVTAPAMGRAVDGLVKRGLVERSPRPGSRRIIGLWITSSGVALAERAQELLESIETEILGGFSPAEREEVRRYMVRLVVGAGVYSLT
ncbi:putative HTH-type transcriptional regulator [Actinomadura sp. RB68]|uniref:Putative HTH-type transcriptional regulator n=1 Tax=Actinomadura macrotermitis TaxID=2585200 RepID=A0A7K0BV63_9ACTN|nr:putative HTH-type transcriptional regulator [Actinomadura macrotermitis]